MQVSCRKIGIAAVTALALIGAAVGTAGTASARGGHWHGGGGFGPGFVGGLALGAVAASPYYYGYGPYAYDYAYGGDCYFQRRVFINSWGRRIVRHVRVCD